MKKHKYLITCCLTLAFAAASHAALWSSYGTPLASGQDDSFTPGPGEPSQNNPNAGQDIIDIYYAASATHHYFRIDLEAAPSPDLGGFNNFSGIYGVYIDADNNTGTGASGGPGGTDYIPYVLSGIDIILDSHYNQSIPAFNQWDRHIHNTGNIFDFYSLNSSEHEENGAVLEWAIAKTELSGAFKFWVATHDSGATAPTYDLEGGSAAAGWVIPEPATAVLIGISCVGVYTRKRFFFD